MIQLLGIIWTVWKLTRKRLGPVGGLVVSIGVALGYVLLQDWLEEEYPRVAALLE